MKKTVTYLTEPFLTQYFLIDAICKGFISDKERRSIFEELAHVFCVPVDEEIEQYYYISDSDTYKKITDYSSYERLCRMIEFAETSGQDVELTEADRVILAQKRESMQIKSEIFKQGKNLTRDIIADSLHEIAMSGNVDAMVTLAFMEYHGICICRDKKNSLKRIELCTKWNNLFGILMSIAYKCGDFDECFDTLYTILKNSNQREVYQFLCTTYGYNKTSKGNAVAKIIEKAFSMNIVNRNYYDRIFAKVAFSKLVSDEDKEKLLLNKKKDAIVSLSEIPFDIERTSMFSFDEKNARHSFLIRTEEANNIFCSVYPALNGSMNLYRTLLVAGNDDYISEMYATAIKKGFSDSNSIIEVDASTLTMQDFVGAKEHFILRGLSETKKSHTVFLIKKCDETGERELDELMKLLDYEFRHKFKLTEPTVSLDLSDVLIVLLASECNENVRKLARECEVVRISSISDEEKKNVIDTMFKVQSKKFGCKNVAVENECKVYLQSFGTEQIIRIIDGALKRAMYENSAVITSDSLRMISKQQNIQKNKREFGYAGGIAYETN